MPQPKRYEDNAGRQAAYRHRKGSTRATTIELANLARCLHCVIEDEVLYGDLSLPKDILASGPEQTMRNLISFLNTIYDPVTNPTGKNIRPSWEERRKIDEQRKIDERKVQD